ncbi:MAG: SURF1 family protein [Gammaproteobacteria bacterium]|jgi:surfeit locus 1 family protein|nr:SURF1 family protein [Gammaproteobacteria bacterium]MBT5602196.1 SURF1 family protein [Gammaproteobacteria bacterium]MBT6246723.1 SURF1 family protein [Gammaproteobacteria bacterium]
MSFRFDLNLGQFRIRINLLVALCALVTVAGLVRLGIWQLNRAADKLTEQEAVQLEYQAKAVQLETIPVALLQAADNSLQNRHVQLTGTYENGHSLLLIAQFYDGQLGYSVVTPLRLQSNGKLILVNRGWITALVQTGAKPSIQPYDGPVTVTGQIHLTQPKPQAYAEQVDSSNWPIRMRFLDFRSINAQLKEPIYPIEVRLAEDQAGGLIRHWPAVHININQNLSYALQWFALALLVSLVSLLASSNLWSLLRDSR